MKKCTFYDICTRGAPIKNNKNEKKTMFICIQEYCSGEEVAPRAEKDGPSCEWEEYEQTGEYINKIDEIIQVNRHY